MEIARKQRNMKMKHENETSHPSLQTRKAAYMGYHNRRVRTMKRAFKMRNAITRLRRDSPLLALLGLAFGVSAWYCWSIGWFILGACIVVVLLACLVMVALDII